MVYLSKGLKISTSIKKLFLDIKNLGSNEKNMIYLSEVLKINSSIEELNLGNNNFGAKEKDMM